MRVLIEKREWWPYEFEWARVSSCWLALQFMIIIAAGRSLASCGIENGFLKEKAYGVSLYKGERSAVK